MRTSRFFIDIPLVPSHPITLPSHLVHYITNVLRLKTGDDIILFNGQGYETSNGQQNSITEGEFSATLIDVKKRQVSAVINHFIKKNIESPLEVNLIQGISRSERMDFTIQKSVELGVHSITPVITERSNTGRFTGMRLDKKMQHWQSVALSACEQSGRTKLISINPPIKVKDIINHTADINLLLAPDAHSNIKEFSETKPQSVNIFIGPEGGLSNAEIEWVMKHRYHKLKLGPRILRTETAGLTALSIFQFLWGDLA